jgi:uncharacterized phage protein (TIGR02220 family)
MKQRFIKYNPNSEMAKFLQTKPIANHLANVIAVRARRTKCPFNKLEIGECFIGDYKKIGITEQQYRTAKKCLKRIGLATFKGTSRGTVAKLVSIEVWDLNLEAPNEQPNANLTNEQRLTKNVKNKELKKKNIVAFKNLVEFFIEHTGKTMRVKKEDSDIINQPNYKLVNARLNDGVTLEEMKGIIEMKNEEWKNDDKNKKYIRFSTFFGSDNVQKYLDELDNKGTQAKSETNTKAAQPLDLETYLKPYYKESELRRMKESGRFEQLTNLLQKESFRLNNIAKGYKNEYFTPLFVFECCYMSLGNKLSGSTPDRKLESLQIWEKKLGDYNRNKGILRELLKEKKI